MNVLAWSNHNLTLNRPGAAGRALQAWDAADEQLIAFTESKVKSGQSVAIVDDAFGALTLALAPFKPVSVADSAGLITALATNGNANGLDAPTVWNWRGPPSGPFDVVVMRIPRQLDYLAYLLRWANQVLKPEGCLIAAGMIKHLPDRSADLFGQLVLTEQVCPAKKKARVIQCRPGAATLTDWPRLWQGYDMPDSTRRLTSLPAVFARDRLDYGTALLIPQVRHRAAALVERSRVLDLACGNGVLGLAALEINPLLAVSFVDISSQAVVSAEYALQQWFPSHAERVSHSDGIPADAGLFDLILLNPPFHEGGVVSDHIAQNLLRQARRHLSPTGRLLLVGNRHLGYHRSLRDIFPRVSQLDADSRFVVFEASLQDAG